MRSSCEKRKCHLLDVILHINLISISFQFQSQSNVLDNDLGPLCTLSGPVELCLELFGPASVGLNWAIFGINKMAQPNFELYRWVSPSSVMVYWAIAELKLRSQWLG